MHNYRFAAVSVLRTGRLLKPSLRFPRFAEAQFYFPYSHNLSSSTWFEYKFLDYTSVRPILMYVIYLHMCHSGNAFLRSLSITFSCKFHFSPVCSILQPQFPRPWIYHTTDTWWRPLGRPKRRWEGNIKMDLQEVGGGCGDWMDLA